MMIFINYTLSYLEKSKGKKRWTQTQDVPSGWLWGKAQASIKRSILRQWHKGER